MHAEADRGEPLVMWVLTNLSIALDSFRATAALAVSNDFGTPQSGNEASRSRRFGPALPRASIDIAIEAPRAE